MNNMASVGNLIEAVLWFGFSIGFGVRAWQRKDERRRLFLILSAAFLAFGVSDLIERRTGAWWRPAGLLMFKAGCIAVFAWGAWKYRKIRSEK